MGVVSFDSDWWIFLYSIMGNVFYLIYHVSEVKHDFIKTKLKFCGATASIEANIMDYGITLQL